MASCCWPERWVYLMVPAFERFKNFQTLLFLWRSQTIFRLGCHESTDFHRPGRRQRHDR